MSIIFPGTYYYSNMIGFKIEQEGRLIIYIYIYQEVADGVIRQNQCLPVSLYAGCHPSLQARTLCI